VPFEFCYRAGESYPELLVIAPAAPARGVVRITVDGDIFWEFRPAAPDSSGLGPYTAARAITAALAQAHGADGTGEAAALSGARPGRTAPRRGAFSPLPPPEEPVTTVTTPRDGQLRVASCNLHYVLSAYLPCLLRRGEEPSGCLAASPSRVPVARAWPGGTAPASGARARVAHPQKHRRRGAQDAAVAAGPARPGKPGERRGTVHHDAGGRPARHGVSPGVTGVPAPLFPGWVFCTTNTKEA